MAVLLHLEFLLCDLPLDPGVLSSVVDERGFTFGDQICSVARAHFDFFEALLLFYFLAIYLLSTLIIILIHLIWLNELLGSLALVEEVGLEVPKAQDEGIPGLEVGSQ